SFFFFRSYSGLTCSSSLLQPCLVLEIYQVSNSYDRSIQISVRTSFPLLELGHCSVHVCRKNSALAAMQKHLNKAFISLIKLFFSVSEQTQDSVYKFEQTAGLSDTGYTPHKGLTAEETRHHHRVPETIQKLQIQSMEAKEERQSSSAQSTPSNTPHSSPKSQRRGWFGSSSSELSIASSNSSLDMAGVDPLASCIIIFFFPAGFALQAYRGAQKPTPMEVMKTQARLADGASIQKVSPPIMEIPTVEGRRHGTRTHKLKPRDMNILTPSGF
uniref:Putative monooxygenase p33MONOX n=1 Tax=Neolamprologus brichardi TaxID=32507 RepID=A0A3Q4HNW5_NEOBR